VTPHLDHRSPSHVLIKYEKATKINPETQKKKPEPEPGTQTRAEGNNEASQTKPNRTEMK